MDWISDTFSQRYTNLQSLVKCLDHRGIASNVLKKNVRGALLCDCFAYWCVNIVLLLSTAAHPPICGMLSASNQVDVFLWRAFCTPIGQLQPFLARRGLPKWVVKVGSCWGSWKFVIPCLWFHVRHAAWVQARRNEPEVECAPCLWRQPCLINQTASSD